MDVAGSHRIAQAKQLEAAGLAGLLRTARGKPWAPALLDFLPLLAATPDDRARLLRLLDDLLKEPDRPLEYDYARRVRLALEGARTP